MTMRGKQAPVEDSDIDLLEPAEVVAALQTSLGTQGETAALSDTPADKGLIGLFKYYLQRFTILMGRLPTSLGQNNAAGSLSVIGSTADPVVVAVGVATNSAASADNDATATFFGWLKYLAGKGTSLISLQTSANALLTTISSDTSTINTAFDVTKLYSGATALTPKFAAISASSSGNNTIVAAVTSKKIRVLSYILLGAGAVNPKFQSGASGTDLTGLNYIAAAGGGVSAPFNPVGWFETASGVLLNLNLSAATAVGGSVVYVEV